MSHQTSQTQSASADIKSELVQRLISEWRLNQLDAERTLGLHNPLPSHSVPPVPAAKEVIITFTTKAGTPEERTQSALFVREAEEFLVPVSSRLGLPGKFHRSATPVRDGVEATAISQWGGDFGDFVSWTGIWAFLIIHMRATRISYDV